MRNGPPARTVHRLVPLLERESFYAISRIPSELRPNLNKINSHEVVSKGGTLTKLKKSMNGA